MAKTIIIPATYSALWGWLTSVPMPSADWSRASGLAKALKPLRLKGRDFARAFVAAWIRGIDTVPDQRSLGAILAMCLIGPHVLKAIPHAAGGGGVPVPPDAREAMFRMTMTQLGREHNLGGYVRRLFAALRSHRRRRRH